MSAPQQVADQIRAQLDRVARLRDQAVSDGLAQAVREIKSLQAKRFRHTYGDFLEEPRRAAATRFFLDELYGDHDFADRDAQFGRIAGAVERLFPSAVGELALSLAEMHALTETLDHQLAGHWLQLGDRLPDSARYLQSWRLTGEALARDRQLAVVQQMGLELQRLTRNPSLWIALKMMRRPANTAGLSALQQFLEAGFSAFRTLGNAQDFLDTVTERERGWLDQLFTSPASVVEKRLKLAWE